MTGNFMRNPIALWAIGLGILLTALLGAAIAGSVTGIPIALIVAALQLPQEVTLKLLAYSSPLWLPLGVGIGVGTLSKFLKGYRQTDPTNE